MPREDDQRGAHLVHVAHSGNDPVGGRELAFTLLVAGLVPPQPITVDRRDA
jgi:hypothetical protein